MQAGWLGKTGVALLSLRWWQKAQSLVLVWCSLRLWSKGETFSITFESTTSKADGLTGCAGGAALALSGGLLRFCFVLRQAAKLTNSIRVMIATISLSRFAVSFFILKKSTESALHGRLPSLFKSCALNRSGRPGFRD